MLTQDQNKKSFRGGSLCLGLTIFATVVLASIVYPASMLHAQSVIAIRGGTILTMTGRTISNGTVLIRGSKIEAVDENVKLPPAAEIVDASGKYVMPGLIDAMTYYGVRPFDLNDTSKPVTPENKIIDGYYPYGEFNRGKSGIVADKEILCGGITTIYIAPGNRQVISGQGAVVKTYGKDLAGMILREPASIEMALGAPPKESFKAKKMSPSTRMSLVVHIREALIEAQEYDLARKRYDGLENEEKQKAQKPKRNLGLEALVKLLHS